MAIDRLRLHHRIVIPFGLAALVATGLVAYIALTVMSRVLEAKATAQIRNAATLVSRSEFALNPAILRNVREITGADVVTYTQDGQVLAAAGDVVKREDVLAHVMAREVPGVGVEIPVGRIDCGAPCFVAYRRVTSRPDAIVAVVAETSDLTAATRMVTRVILAAAGLSVLLIILVSQMIARRVTAPIAQLVRFAEELTPDGSAHRAPTGTTEVGRLGDAFNSMLDRLDRSQSALVRSEKLALAGVLAARVAHDIRNPLSSIKMQTQLLRSSSEAGSEQEVVLADVLRDINQVEIVIRDLLELARPGQLALQPTVLNEVVRDMLRQMGAQLEHRRIAVHVALDPALPATALDPDRFKQVLANVLTNASEAMPTGGHLEIATRTNGASTILLTVADDGTGIEPELLTRVFDPFVSTKREGIGLGLVNAKAVVELHGGTIEVGPHPGGGTCVSISLPIRNVPSTTSGGAESLHG